MAFVAAFGRESQNNVTLGIVVVDVNERPIWNTTRRFCVDCCQIAALLGLTPLRGPCVARMLRCPESVLGLMENTPVGTVLGNFPAYDVGHTQMGSHARGLLWDPLALLLTLCALKSLGF
jgi:hypothetical protein